MQHKCEKHSFSTKLHTQVPNCTRNKAQSVTSLSKHLTTRIQGGWWSTEYQFMIGWNIFTTPLKECFMGLHSLIQRGQCSRFPQVEAGYTHASIVQDKTSFPCMFLSARNSTIIDNSLLNQWQCYFLPLIHSWNTVSTLVWHGRILNILKFSMINGEFSACSWMLKSVSQRTLLMQV